HGHHALLGAQPAQLRVADELAVDPAQIGEHLLDVAAHQVRGEGGDGRALHVVAAADREHQRGALVRGVGAQREVGGGVVRIRVHRVGAVEVAAGGEADVLDVERGEEAHRVSRCWPAGAGTKVVRWLPSASMPISATSPASRYGNRPERATPCGVPVLRRSPGESTMYCERRWTICATVKIMSAVVEYWRASALTAARKSGGQAESRPVQ